MRSALFLDVTHRKVITPYRRFGTSFRPDLQWSRNLLKMGPIGCPERSVRNYHSTLR